jgi:hypothetical protein
MSMLVQIRVLVHDERRVLLVTGLLQPLVDSDGIACICLVDHRVPPVQAGVRVCSWLPEPLEHVLLCGDFSVRQLPCWLLCTIFEYALSNPSVTVLRQVPVRSLVALLLAYDHGMLQITLWLLEADVFLVHLGVVHVPCSAINDTGLWYSRIIPEQLLLIFYRVCLKVRNISPVELSGGSLRHVLPLRHEVVDHSF